MAKQYDFTEGNIFKQLFIFSAPIIVTNLLQVSYQFIDSLWVGNLIGSDALGAVAISGTVIFTVLSFVIGLNNAALTILSQQKGERERVRAQALFECIRCLAYSDVCRTWDRWFYLIRAYFDFAWNTRCHGRYGRILFKDQFYRHGFSVWIQLYRNGVQIDWRFKDTPIFCFGGSSP